MRRVATAGFLLAAFSTWPRLAAAETLDSSSVSDAPGSSRAERRRPFLERGSYFRTSFGWGQFWIHSKEARPDGTERALTATGGFGVAVDLRAGAAVSRTIVVGGALMTDMASVTERDQSGQSTGGFLDFSQLGPFVAFYPFPDDSGLSITGSLGWSIASRPMSESLLNGPAASLGFNVELRDAPRLGFGFRSMLAPMLRGSTQQVFVENQFVNETASGYAWTFDMLATARF